MPTPLTSSGLAHSMLLPSYYLANSFHGGGDFFILLLLPTSVGHWNNNELSFFVELWEGGVLMNARESERKKKKIIQGYRENSKLSVHREQVQYLSPSSRVSVQTWNIHVYIFVILICAILKGIL